MDRRFLSLMVFAAAVIVAGCAQPRIPARSQPFDTPVQGTGRPAASKRLVAAIQGNPHSLVFRMNPASLNIPGQAELERLLGVGLAAADDRGALQPYLSESVPTLENGLWKVLPDGQMETVWKLRPGASWHDGAPFTAEDVLFTTRVEQDREVPITRSAAYESIERIDAADAWTVVVGWKRPYIEADIQFLDPPFPRHLLEKTYIEDRGALPQLPHWTRDFVGTGPFKLQRWAPGSHVVLQANETYVLGRPKIDELEVRFIPDVNTLMSNILAGEVELTLGRGWSLEQALQMREQWRDGQPIVALTSWIMAYPQFLNPQPSLVADVRFRRALMHAIDRQQIADTVEYGLVPVAHAYLNPNEPEYREIESAIVRYDYDPRKAVRIVEELGYTRSSDGMFRDPANQPLAVEVRTTIESDIHHKTIHPLADYWKQVGVAVETVIIPSQRQQDREYMATFPAFYMIRQPNSRNSVKRYRGTESRTPERGFIGNNYNRYMNPEFDALIDKYFSTLPRPERLQTLAQIVHHMTDQLTLIGLFYDTQPVLVGNRVLNVTNTQAGSVNQSWNAHLWELKH